jgi:hypothetical protein
MSQYDAKIIKIYIYVLTKIIWVRFLLNSFDKKHNLLVLLTKRKIHGS